MGIVLPDGILGNPNTEGVRAWILERYRILASVDLPVEAFLPQVGVQASLLFLEKKTETERALARNEEEDYPVFMAIAEKVGKDRRGKPIYVRNEEGEEIKVKKEIESRVYNRQTRTREIKKRQVETKDIDDDLPRIGKAYKIYREGGKL